MFNRHWLRRNFIGCSAINILCFSPGVHDQSGVWGVALPLLTCKVDTVNMHVQNVSVM